MSSWSDLAFESLGAAKLLLTEGLHRSSASRSYYAAYAAATAALMKGGADVAIAGRANPSHIQLIQLVRHNLDPRRHSPRDRSDLARRMRNLFRSRVMADYDPGARVDRVEALRCVRDASALMATLGASDDRG